MHFLRQHRQNLCAAEDDDDDLFGEFDCNLDDDSHAQAEGPADSIVPARAEAEPSKDGGNLQQSPVEHAQCLASACWSERLICNHQLNELLPTLLRIRMMHPIEACQQAPDVLCADPDDEPQQNPEISNTHQAMQPATAMAIEHHNDQHSASGSPDAEKDKQTADSLSEEADSAPLFSLSQACPSDALEGAQTQCFKQCNCFWNTRVAR